MIGSLHTMNFLKPYGFLNKLKLFFKNRNSASLEVQYGLYNVRAFDFHIDFTKTNKAIFKYDGMPYETFSIYNYLNYLNAKKDTVVQISLEDMSLSSEKEARFKEYCSIIENIYKNITFIGGFRVNDKKKLYEFKRFYPNSKIVWCKNFK